MGGISQETCFASIEGERFTIADGWDLGETFAIRTHQRPWAPSECVSVYRKAWVARGSSLDVQRLEIEMA